MRERLLGRLFGFWARICSLFFELTLHDVGADLMKGLTKDLSALVINVLQEAVNASLDNAFVDLILDEELN